jgi:hypothetical protein
LDLAQALFNLTPDLAQWQNFVVSTLGQLSNNSVLMPIILLMWLKQPKKEWYFVTKIVLVIEKNV